MEHVQCNFCSSSEAESIGIFRDVIFELPGEFSYVRCRQCGLIYLQDRPDPIEIGAYYPGEYQPYRKAIQDERFWFMQWARHRNIQKYCQVVERYARSRPGTILDVGCSTGIFLDAMRQLGWQTLGVEISPDAVKYARQRFGLEVFEGQLSDVRLEKGRVDAITLWNVFEHLHQPMETLTYIFHLLRPGGLLVMVYPSWESLDRRLFAEGWVGFDAPRHLFVYPLPVAQKMVAKVGFDVLSTSCGPNNYFAFTASLHRWLRLKITNKGLADFLARAANFPGVRFLFQPVFSVMDYLGWGGTRMVVAIKG